MIPKVRYILNQDRDRVHEADIMSLHPMIREDIGCVQLIMDENGETVILGDFDTLEEIVEEISDICNCKTTLYKISGYGGDLEW